MTREEYLNLVQGMPVFKELESDLQQKILGATGPRMQELLGLLNSAGADLTKAKRDFLVSAADAVKTMRVGAKQEDHDFMAKAEVITHENEITLAEESIKNI